MLIAVEILFDTRETQSFYVSEHGVAWKTEQSSYITSIMRMINMWALHRYATQSATSGLLYQHPIPFLNGQIITMFQQLRTLIFGIPAM